MSELKRIGVFTSGGDAPGMNAAIRAVVRTCAYYDLHCYGIYRGYSGMIDGDINRLDKADVANIIQRGGTILKTARSEEFRTHEGRKKAYESLLAYEIDALVAIGGNGTFAGADLFSSEFGIPIIGVPGTIDNDLFGTDLSIGFDTAINTAMEAVDKIRDTAEAHHRLFFIEVMGRHSGFIALYTGIGSGAGSVIIPEKPIDIEKLIENLHLSGKRKKMFNLIIVAEGSPLGGATAIAKMVKDRIHDYDIKVAIIGHLQRGGSPTALDRLLASRLGYGAIHGLMEGKTAHMVGVLDNKVIFTPFVEATSREKWPNDDLIKMAEIIAM